MALAGGQRDPAGGRRTTSGSSPTSPTPAEHLYPRPKLLIVNYPHNPDGRCVEPEFYVEVVKLAKRYGFMVISDFAYADVTFDGYKTPSFLAAPGRKDVGVEFTTMSKGYNMAGWRIGFCAGNAEMVRALATIKGYYDYGMFQPIQIAAIMALRHCRRGRRGPGQGLPAPPRRAVRRAASGSAGRSSAPRPRMFVWAKIPRALGQPDELHRLRHEAAGRGRRGRQPGAGFGPAGEGYLRLALVENENRLRQAVRQIGRCLGASGNQGRG